MNRMTSETNPNKKSRIPWVTALGTGLLLIAGLGLQASIGWLHDWFRLDPAIPLLSGVGLAGLAFVWWMIWIITRQQWTVRRRCIVLAGLLAIPILGISLFRPILGGDLELVGWEWRFSERTGPLKTADGSTRDRTNLLAETSHWDFPEFFGPGRRGIISGIELDPDWNAHPPELVWKSAVGEGWSGVSAVNRCLVTMEQRGDQECVTCYALDTGELLWLYSHAARHEDTAGMGKVGPRSTPTIHGGRVYAQGATGIVVCLNGLDGSLIWKRDVCEILGIARSTGTNLLGYRYEEEPALAWGRAASPLVVGDLVVVPGGGNPGGPKTTLIAFDKQTGDEVWRGGDQMIAYGSPSLATIGGASQIHLVGESAALGFDPANGRVLWQVSRPGSSTGSANCSQVTVVSDYHVLLTKGYNLGGELIALDWEDGIWKTETVWKSHRVLTTKLTNPVIRDGHAYALSDGFLECVRLDEGALCWKQRGRFSHGQLLLVGDWLLVHSQDGRMMLIKATPLKYEPVGEFKTIRGVCWNTFCVYGPYVVVRSELEMACFRLPILSNVTRN